MRVATESDIPRLQEVYDEALAYAGQVGHIDWPSPFPQELIEKYIVGQELFCFEENDVIVAALRQTSVPDRRVWGEKNVPALYLAKIAASASVQGHRYFAGTMLPEVVPAAKAQNVMLRLDCLLDNPGLISFYKGLGFVGAGINKFYSATQQKALTVLRMELRQAKFERYMAATEKASETVEVSHAPEPPE